MRKYGQYVDAIWIQQRMRARQDRLNEADRAARPRLDVLFSDPTKPHCPITVTDIWAPRSIVDVAIVPVSMDTKGVVTVALAPMNATCDDCHAPYRRGVGAVGFLCEVCWQHRDRHTDALELRMAKASARAHAVERQDIA